MREFNTFRHLPSSGKFHSCILSTYSIDLHFFDSYLRRDLNKQGIQNIIILCDPHSLNHSIDHFHGDLKYLRNTYTITPLESKTLFHSKVFMFYGEDSMLLQVGSGNLTSGGFGRNHELFSSIGVLQEKGGNHLPLILQAHEYMVSLVDVLEGSVKSQILWIEQNCNLLLSDEIQSSSGFINLRKGVEAAFLSTMPATMIDQFHTLVDSTSINLIRICSPFYDAQGTFVRQLIDDFPNAQIEIFFQEAQTKLPDPIIIDKRIKYIDWTSTQVYQDLKYKGSFLHAKGFLLHSEKYTYILHGSPNATAAGFGLKGYQNGEAALLYRIENPNNSILTGLEGVQSYTTPEDISSYKTREEPKHRNRINNKVRIKKAELKSEFIFISLKLLKSVSGIHIKFMDPWKDEVGSFPLKEKSLEEYNFSILDFPALKNAVLAQIVDEAGQSISDYHFINNTWSIAGTNPSKENRKHQKVIYSLEHGSVSDFDFVSHLNDVLSERGALQTKPSKSSKKKSKKDTTPKSYDDAKKKARSGDIETSERVGRKAEQIWNTTLNTLRRFYLKQQDRLADQDEEGYQQGGGNNQEDQDDPNLFTSKTMAMKSLMRKRDKMVRDYEKYFEYLNSKNNDKDYVIDYSEYVIYLSLLLNLIQICDKPFKANIKVPVSDGETKPVKQQILETLFSSDLTFFEGSLSYLITKLIGQFCLLLWRNQHKSYDDEISSARLARYKKEATYMTYIALMMASGIYKKHEDKQWIPLLWLNIRLATNVNYNKGWHELFKILEREINSKYIEDITSDRGNDLDKKADQIEEEAEKGTTFIRIPDFGIFKVIEHGPKFARVAFPGLHYNPIKGDYIKEKVYQFEKKEFLKSFKTR